jgi:hypothetical protein
MNKQMIWRIILVSVTLIFLGLMGHMPFGSEISVYTFGLQ